MPATTNHSLASLLATGPVAPWRLDLIGRYSTAVAAHAPRLDARYPGEDCEPLMFTALYLAALTYRPGPREFWTWYQSKTRGQLNRLRQRRARHAAGLKDTRGRRAAPVRIIRLDPAAIDAQQSYRDPDPSDTTGSPTWPASPPTTTT